MIAFIELDLVEAGTGRPGSLSGSSGGIAGLKSVNILDRFGPFHGKIACFVPRGKNPDLQRAST